MHGLNTYDYGARQYDPLLAVWHGVDPLCEKDYGTGTNVYCRNNPLILKDSDGNFPDIVWDVANVILGVSSLSDNIKQRNWGSATVDGIGIAVDVAAAVLPGIPGGASTLIKSSRLTKNISRAKTSLKRNENTSKVTRRASFRQAKRDAGIPTIQNFITHKKVDAAKNGKSGQKSIEYEFNITDSYGKQEKRFVQDHFEGHIYIDGNIDNSPHFNIHQHSGTTKIDKEKNHYPYDR